MSRIEWVRSQTTKKTQIKNSKPYRSSKKEIMKKGQPIFQTS